MVISFFFFLLLKGRAIKIICGRINRTAIKFYLYIKHQMNVIYFLFLSCPDLKFVLNFKKM